jgi:capsular polysaccharide biosynthesis protein/Mrp family chromosome partitioning ATPase
VEGTGVVGTLRRWWATLLLAAVVAAAGSWVLAESLPETYEASTRLIVGPLAGNQDVVEAAGQLARTDAEVAESQSLLDDAARALGLPPEEVDAEVQASANEVTRLLVITVRDDDAAQAANLANALADALGDRIAESPIGPEGALSVLDAAAVPSEPAEPNVSRIVTLSVLATLVGAIAVALLIERLDDRISGPGQIEHAAPGAFVVGLPPWRHRRGTARAVVARPGSPSGAALRLTATSVELALPEGRRALLVTGTEPGEVAEDVAVNLAAALSSPRRRVLVIDASTEGSLRRSIGREVVRPAPGGSGAADHVDPGVGSGFELLADDVAAMGAGFSVDEARSTLEELRRAADWIIVHAEPVSAAATALVWAGVCDATLLVAQQGRTRRPVLDAAVESVERVGGSVAGVVFLERRSRRRMRRMAAPAHRAKRHAAAPEPAAAPPLAAAPLPTDSPEAVGDERGRRWRR